MDILERTAEELETEDQGQQVDCKAVIWLCKVIRKTIDWTPTSSAIVGMFIQTVKDRAE